MAPGLLQVSGMRLLAAVAGLLLGCSGESDIDHSRDSFVHSQTGIQGVAPIPRTVAASDVDGRHAIPDILDHAVKMVESRPENPVALLASLPGSIVEGSRLIMKATGHRIYEQVEYRGWWLFSKTPGPGRKPTLRFHDGYGIRPGTARVYAFGFW